MPETSPEGGTGINIADKIRRLAEMVDRSVIAQSLSIPQEVVDGVLDGTIAEDKLIDFDPSQQIAIIETQIITRGRVLAVLQDPQLAAEMAIYISQQQMAAVVDLEPYSVLPLYLGAEIKNIPQVVNILWDEYVDKKEFKKNLFVYTIPNIENLPQLQSNILANYPTVIINFPSELWVNIAPLADMIYLPVPQNNAGLYKLYQITMRNKIYEKKMQAVWISESPANNTKYISGVRVFSNIYIAGNINESGLSISPGRNQKNIAKILEVLFPEVKRNKILGLF